MQNDTLTHREIQIAREWLKDCAGCYENIQEPEDVDDFTDEEIINGIRRDFNGLENFRKGICVYAD